MQNENLAGKHGEKAVGDRKAVLHLKSGSETSVRTRSVSVIDRNLTGTALLEDYLRNSSCFILGRWYSTDRVPAREITESPPDVLLVDASLTGDLGVQCSRLRRSLRLMKRELSIVMITESPDLPDCVRCLLAGADGYVALRGSREAFEQSVHEAINGWKPLPREIQKLLSTYLVRRFAGGNATALTAAEFDVLTGLIQGKTDKEIAAKRRTSLGTIHTITNNLYKKTDSHSRAQVVSAFLPLDLALPKQLRHGACADASHRAKSRSVRDSDGHDGS